MNTCTIASRITDNRFYPNQLAPKSIMACVCALVLHLVSALLLISPSIAETPANNEATVSARVKQLGLKTGDAASDFLVFQSSPAAAVPLLVNELHPIPRRTYFENTKNPDARHVIACLRALRYLTGLTFSARSKATLTSDEQQFLDFKNEMHDENPTHQLHFFSVWMSRNAIFVAPPDAQRSIIEEWHHWWKTEGTSFGFRQFGNPKDSMEEWYWFG